MAETNADIGFDILVNSFSTILICLIVFVIYRYTNYQSIKSLSLNSGRSCTDHEADHTLIL